MTSYTRKPFLRRGSNGGSSSLWRGVIGVDIISVPPTALLTEDGIPILTESGEYILTES